jgi:hypothetical protein
VVAGRGPVVEVLLARALADRAVDRAGAADDAPLRDVPRRAHLGRLEVVRLIVPLVAQKVGVVGVAERLRQLVEAREERACLDEHHLVAFR